MSSFSSGEATGRTTSQRRAVGVMNISWQTENSSASIAVIDLRLSAPWLTALKPATYAAAMSLG